MEETRVKLGYLLKSQYSHTLSLLIPYCVDRVWVYRRFVMEISSTPKDIKISVKCTSAHLLPPICGFKRCEKLFCTILKPYIELKAYQ